MPIDPNVLSADVVFENGNYENIELEERQIFYVERDAFNFFPHLQSINLSNNLLSWLPKNVFETCHNLKKLQLNRNLFTIIDAEQFTKLTQLEELNFSGNLLTSIQGPPFLAIRSLRSLNLSGNQLNRLHEQTFHSLPNLIELDLSHNQLVVLEPDLFTINNRLETLLLNQNCLIRLCPIQFCFLIELRTVNLESNLLLQIPEQLFDFSPQLRSLNFDRNRIANLKHRSLSKSKQLVYLTIHLTRQFSIDVLNGLHNIVRLHLRFDSSAVLSAKLICLILYKNMLLLQDFRLIVKFLLFVGKQKTFILPQTLRTLHVECVEEINEWKNSLNFANQMKDTPNLQEFTFLVANNLLVEALANYTNSKEIYGLHSLKFTNAETVSKKPAIFPIFFVNLRILDLSFCAIPLNAKFAFRHLINLERINIQGVKMEKIWKNLLGKNLKLTHIDLSSCSICEIEKNAFKPLKRLKFLNLENNNFDTTIELDFYGLERHRTEIKQ